MTRQPEAVYGVQAKEGGDIDFGVRLERALEVLNSFDDEPRFVAVWRGSSQVTIFGDGVLLLSYGDGGSAFPDRFEDLVDGLAVVVWSILGEDEDIFNRKFLLERARSMEEEGVERTRLMIQIESMFSVIFQDEESKRAAEEKVLAAWAAALGEHGWIVSGVDLLRQTRLPILGNEMMLIYHGSPRYSPRYFRVFRSGGAVVGLERIWADNLAGVIREGVEIDGVGDISVDEIQMVREVLAGMCPQEEKDSTIP